MSNDEDWKVVNRRRRGRVLKHTHVVSVPCCSDPQTIFKKVLEARSVVRSSQFFSNLVQVIKQTSSSGYEEIICYGLGRFSSSYQALYQLGLLLELQTDSQVVQIYDPVFSDLEKEVLTNLGLVLISKNEEGKRLVVRDTLFFLPHCPKELFNNLLWANWGTPLRHCTILGNRHSEILAYTAVTTLKQFWYICQITPALRQRDIINDFKYEDVFNNMAVHMFPAEKLSVVPDSIWRHRELPVYLDDDELVRS
ncbi:SRR1-like protein isoform X2 [Rhodnius prolixus]|uniref:SRR1-like protein isoform X2 n=1 Tax=Rhodnius prolixus TaxID=13249 RepID=UPI003D18D00D